MSAFDVYSVYLAVKSHFTTDKYDFFRYGGKTRTSEEKFNQRNDRYFFEKLGSKYNQNEVLEYFVSNFLVNSNFYIKEMKEENWIEWNRKKQSMTYLFGQDIESILARYETLNTALQCTNMQHSGIIKMYLGGHIMIETLVILDRMTKYSTRYDSILANDVVWKSLSKTVKKYAAFVNFDTLKAKEIISSKV
jgi:hypothetical protein